MAIEVREDILDEDLAAELLAEKADVAADHRAEVEQHRELARGQRLKKFLKGFGGEKGILDLGRGEALGPNLGVAPARRESI
jgi:hypothetical protein